MIKHDSICSYTTHTHCKEQTREFTVILKSLINRTSEFCRECSVSTAISTHSIGCFQGQRLGSSTSDSSRHLFQCLAIALCRGNACLWLYRLPHLPSSLMDSCNFVKISVQKYSLTQIFRVMWNITVIAVPTPRRKRSLAKMVTGFIQAISREGTWAYKPFLCLVNEICEEFRLC